MYSEVVNFLAFSNFAKSIPSAIPEIVNPFIAVETSRIELFKKLLPMALGSNLLFGLFEGVSGPTLKKSGFGTPTISLSGTPNSFASPKSCKATIFLRLFSVVLTLFCLLVIQTSKRVI